MFKPSFFSQLYFLTTQSEPNERFSLSVAPLGPAHTGLNSGQSSSQDFVFGVTPGDANIALINSKTRQKKNGENRHNSTLTITK